MLLEISNITSAADAQTLHGPLKLVIFLNELYEMAH